MWKREKGNFYRIFARLRHHNTGKNENLERSFRVPLPSLLKHLKCRILRLHPLNARFWETAPSMTKTERPSVGLLDGRGDFLIAIPPPPHTHQKSFSNQGWKAINTQWMLHFTCFRILDQIPWGDQNTEICEMSDQSPQCIQNTEISTFRTRTGRLLILTISRNFN